WHPLPLLTPSLLKEGTSGFSPPGAKLQATAIIDIWPAGQILFQCFAGAFSRGVKIQSVQSVHAALEVAHPRRFIKKIPNERHIRYIRNMN
ncbi:MAG: hypothetical protein ACOVQM_08220, partial [Pirellula sp.]